MKPIDIASILVAVIAALGAWASQRAASKASSANNVVTSRLDAEKEAYERARAFDLETIDRQQRELNSLRSENARLHRELEALHADNERMNEELRMLRMRVSRIERGFPQALEAMLRERVEEDESSDDQE